MTCYSPPITLAPGQIEDALYCELPTSLLLLCRKLSGIGSESERRDALNLAPLGQP